MLVPMGQDGVVEQIGDVVRIADETIPDHSSELRWHSIDDSAIEIIFFEIGRGIVADQFPKH
jgi:hypothetical protein